MRLFVAATIACAICTIIAVAGPGYVQAQPEAAEDVPRRTGEFTVSQKDWNFEPGLLNAKVGDTVLLVNDDRYAHNLYSETPGFEFNVRKQMPGDTHSIKLDKRGKIEIRCAIHPRMKLTINVE
jgi:plastocyanin